MSGPVVSYEAETELSVFMMFIRGPVFNENYAFKNSKKLLRKFLLCRLHRCNLYLVAFMLFYL